MSSCCADPTSLYRQVLVRYRAPGHVRFQLPDALCEAGRAQRLEDALRRVDGVYRVDLYRRQGKLSIRYDEAFCDMPALARGLGEGIASAMAESVLPVSGYGLAVLGQSAIAASKPARWLKEKYQEAAETLTAAKLLVQRGRTPAQRERFVLEFCNDVLVLYLIKAHWQAITTQWMRRPWLYRYEWTAAFYMIYLLVRWRRSKR